MGSIEPDMKMCMEQDKGRRTERNRLAGPRAETAPAATEELFALPLDLTEWIEQCTLLEWVEADVEQFDWKHPELVAYLGQHPEYRPKSLLCLLTYAYAIQVYGSEEIVNRCYSDTVFRLLSENKAPAAAELRRFRRENRGLLKGMLMALFTRAVRQKFALGDVLLPAGFKRYLLDAAVERLDIARYMDHPSE